MHRRRNEEERRLCCSKILFLQGATRQWQTDLEEKRSIWSSPERKATTRGSSIFQMVDTKREKGPFCGKQKALVGERVALQESWQNEWQDMKYQGIMAKAPPYPERTMKTQLPQHSSSSTRDEENQWISVEDGRKRHVAFEEAAKRMLRYLEDSEDLRVGVERTDGNAGRSRFPSCKLPRKQGTSKAYRSSTFLGKERKRCALPVWQDGTRN